MRRAGPLLLLAALGTACAHLQRTDRLDEAQAAYQRALQGPAAAASPADLATAKKWLDLAQVGLQTGDPKLVDDRATVAILKVEAAEAMGRTHALAAERDRTLRELAATKQQLLDDAQQRLAQAQVDLEREKAARDAAEARLEQGRAVLAREAEICDLPEGTVITLPGGKLFARGRADLLPAGRDRLAQVAEFLKTASRPVRIEGQPPSRKPKAVALSGQRAERVREFLVGEGLTPDQIRAAPPAPAPTRPLPSSPEFAANGAVDIVLEPAMGGGGTGPGRP